MMKVMISSLIKFFFLSLVFVLLFSCSREQKKNVYKIGRDINWSSVSLQGREKNMSAFIEELLSEVSLREHIKIQLYSIRGNTLVKDLDREYDGIISSLSPSYSTLSGYIFSDSFYLLGPVLLTRESAKISSIQDIQGMIIGIPGELSTVFTGDVLFPSVNFVTYANVNVALNNLLSNVLDGVILNSIPAYAYTTGYYAGKIKVATPPLTDLGLRLITSRHSAELVKYFNRALKQMIEDGTYEKLLKRWDLFNTMKLLDQEKVL